MDLEIYFLKSGSLWFSDAFSMKMLKFLRKSRSGKLHMNIMVKKFPNWMLVGFFFNAQQFCEKVCDLKKKKVIDFNAMQRIKIR